MMALADSFTGRIEKIMDVDGAGGCLFYLSTQEGCVIRNAGNGLVACRYMYRYIKEHLYVRLEGEWQDGVFYVRSYEPQGGDLADVVEYLCHNCKGVGMITAKKVALKYGGGIFSIPEGKFREKLADDFPELSGAKVRKIVNALNLKEDDEKKRELEEYLFPYGVAYPVILDIFAEYQGESMEKVRTGIYQLGITYEISLGTCDRIAKDNGLSPYLNDRVRFLCFQVMKKQAENGHTYVELGRLQGLVSAESEKSLFHVRIPDICTNTALVGGNLFVTEERKVSLRWYHDAERSIAASLRALNRGALSIRIQEADVLEAQAAVGVEYSSGQKAAFQALCTDGVKIINGGPGTGKTTLTRGIIYVYQKYFPESSVAEVGKGQVRLAAPTGRAAKRLSESTGHEAATVHKLIDYRPYGKASVHTKNRMDPIKAGLIIVDESSMLDVQVGELLFNAIRIGSTVLIIGDENQLPPVGAGNVLHDMIGSGRFEVYQLTENYRQKDKEMLYGNNSRILRGEMPQENDHFHIRRVNSDRTALEVIKRLAAQLYDKDDINKTQIIESCYKGAAGIDEVNAFMQGFIAGAPVRKGCLCVHDKVIFTKTDYHEGIINGELGEITAIGDMEVTVRTGDGCVQVRNGLRNHVKLAYSGSIHKFEGSEFDNVIIFLPERPAVMLKRSLLYTAVTRARENVYLVYTGDALQKCLASEGDEKRSTRLLEFLMEK